MPYRRAIVTEGAAVLRKVAKRVEPKELADPLLQQLIDDMFVTMYEAPGIGLAAPQVGVAKRVFTVDLQDDEDDHGPFAVINPHIVEREDEIEATEGCLSVPGFIGEIVRARRVVVNALDRNGEKIVLRGEGLFARCLQHEIDHLDGKLYKDRATNVRAARSEEEDAEVEEPPGASREGAA